MLSDFLYCYDDTLPLLHASEATMRYMVKALVGLLLHAVADVAGRVSSDLYPRTAGMVAITGNLKHVSTG